MRQTTEPSLTALRRARVAVSTIFFINGAIIATYAVRLPTIKENLGLPHAALGVALFGASAGAVVAMQLVGRLTARLGSGPVTAVSLLVNCALLPLVAVAWNWGTLIVAMVLIGASIGVVDPAMNAHGVTVQRGFGRPILGTLHGLWSLGGLAGSLAGGAAARAGLTPLMHFVLVAVVFAVAGGAASTRLLPPGADRAPSRRAERPGRTGVSLWSRRVVLLGTVALCSFAAEGTAMDWSAVYLREDLGASAGVAAAGFAAFSLTMAGGRFVSDRLVVLLGRVRVVRAGALLAAAGLGAALLLGHPVAGLAGFGLLGAGLSVVVPAAFSTAGELGGAGGGGLVLARVLSFAYVGVLAAPPIVGGLAELLSLPMALGLAVVLSLTIAACAPAAAEPEPDPEHEPEPRPSPG